MARTPSSTPIGDQLRKQRIEVMRRTLRDVAKALDVTPAHLTDIETGKRNPSEELLMRIVRVYGLEEAVLRAGWSKPDADVAAVASHNPVNAAKAPEFMRAARDLSSDQWDALIDQARRLAKKTARQSKTTKKKT